MEDYLLWIHISKAGKFHNLAQPLIKVRFNSASVTIDEKWRGKRFRTLKQGILERGMLSEAESAELLTIIRKQNSHKIKQGSYYAICGKKFLVNNYQPKKARQHLKKAIDIYPLRLDNYALLLASFFPYGYIDRTNNFSVALIARSTLYEVPGGDTVQILQTAAHLRDMGIKATVKLTNEKIDYEAYTILHFFNITRPADILIHIQKSKTPFVITPILIDYSEYDKYIRGGISGFCFRFLPRDTIEYCKTVARWLRGTDRLMSPSYLWMGQRRSIRSILKEANFILPNSHSEYRRVIKEYGFEAKHKIVPNGIDPALFKEELRVLKIS
ncbi:hypothetical protein F5148DRAFT_1296827 [Russula earlei]|uniref:Uncharacterized protein n=1 Tax=Russula earlei TaxID=71964 RepID=A0ACC0TR64_9AGAM|nr:hypothetical protein F5148DRAFT_1296827 [Russula earlei]